MAFVMIVFTLIVNSLGMRTLLKKVKLEIDD